MAAGVCVLLWSLSSFAALGGDVASVQADAVHLQGTLHVTAYRSYAIHEIQTPTGVTVREYLSPAGKVFAVAWQGPSMPDLHQLLGSNFAQFQGAARSAKQRPGRGPLSIHQANLVVEQSGHMRFYSGRAFLSDQFPLGVTAESIR
jgi:hypothetical protein